MVPAPRQKDASSKRESEVLTAALDDSTFESVNANEVQPEPAFDFHQWAQSMPPYKKAVQPKPPFDFQQWAQSVSAFESVPPFDLYEWAQSMPPYKKGKEIKKSETWGTSIWQSITTLAQEKRKELKETFLSWKYTVCQSVSPVIPPRPDSTNVFLSHAKLHVFAEKFDIETLKSWP